MFYKPFFPISNYQIMLNQSLSRMVFSNSKISYSKQTNALNIFLTQNPILLDVRTIHEFARTKIPEAINIPFEELPNQLDLIHSWGNSVIIYCNDGHKSRLATQLLKTAKINAFDGGARKNLIKLLQKKKVISD